MRRLANKTTTEDSLSAKKEDSPVALFCLSGEIGLF